MNASSEPGNPDDWQHITDSLYNPSYGYFSKEAVIFSPGEPFDFNSMRDELEFQAELGRRYTEFEDLLDERDGESPTRQLWHTPTELFRPHYGEAIARYLVSNYRLTTYPYDDLLIFEMGAGRGTLMLNILDYIRAADPQVYARTKFNIIEISSSLAALQSQHLLSTAESRGHADKVEIVNRSIFDWDRYVPSPCFFLAMEVFDNFSHDGIRYDVLTEEPLQGHVLIDGDGDFYEFYVHELDPLAARFFRVRHAATGGNYPKPYPSNPLLRYLSTKMPFAANLSEAEFIPTRLMQFFDVLEKYFPAHRLLTSDFDSLPQAIKGLNAPVVQTRFQRKMVPVTTPLVSLHCQTPSTIFLEPPFLFFYFLFFIFIFFQVKSPRITHCMSINPTITIFCFSFSFFSNVGNRSTKATLTSSSPQTSTSQKPSTAPSRAN
jgi:hypothetical protein